MKFRAYCVFFFILLIGATLLAGSEFFPLAEVRPGLTGTGKTCLRGREVVEFRFEVLGILHNIIAGHDVILVRLSGQNFEKTGVFAGMSGSPVYVDGKLLGAVAYAFAFSTEPIAGVTPFEEMKEVFQKNTAAPRPTGPLSIVNPAAVDFREFMRHNAAALDSTMSLKSDKEPLKATSPLQPIATPLMTNGCSRRALDEFQDMFRELGFIPVSGLATATGDTPGGATPKIQAGNGIAVNLISGDVNMGAGGTVTEVDGTAVYAFGHSFMSIGATAMPMCDSETITVVPNLNAPLKFFTTGAPIGVIRQDRVVGVWGQLGDAANTMPVNLTVSSTRRQNRVFRFQIVRDPVLSGLLLNFGLFSCLSGEERSLGFTTVAISATIHLKNGEDVSLRNVFSSPVGAINQAANYIAVPLQYLMISGFAEADVERIDVSAKLRDSAATARLDNVWISKLRVRPGETVKFRASLLRQDGSFDKEDFSLTIPNNIPPGPVQVYVGDGANLNQLDQQLEPAMFQIYNASQLVRAIRNLRQDGTIYLKLFRKGDGIYSRGSDFPVLPPSYLDIFKDNRAQSTSIPIRYIHYLEKSLGDRDCVVSGYRNFQLVVEPY